MVEETTEPVHLRIVASSNSPFGMGVVGPVNFELNKVLKKLQSPSDNFTYILRCFTMPEACVKGVPPYLCERVRYSQYGVCMHVLF